MQGAVSFSRLDARCLRSFVDLITTEPSTSPKAVTSPRTAMDEQGCCETRLEHARWTVNAGASPEPSAGFRVHTEAYAAPRCDDCTETSVVLSQYGSVNLGITQRASRETTVTYVVTGKYRTGLGITMLYSRLCFGLDTYVYNSPPPGTEERLGSAF